MSLDDIITLTEEICNLDRKRREKFRAEFRRFESNESEEFSETRQLLAKERSKLDELETQLALEKEEISDLTAESEFLSVPQAVKHREASLETLRKHNRQLREFCSAMQAALDIVDGNLQTMLEEGVESVSESPEDKFEAAEDALEAHNRSVSGLRKNLTIFNAYMVGT